MRMAAFQSAAHRCHRSRVFLYAFLFVLSVSFSIAYGPRDANAAVQKTVVTSKDYAEQIVGSGGTAGDPNGGDNSPSAVTFFQPVSSPKSGPSKTHRFAQHQMLSMSAIASWLQMWTSSLYCAFVRGRR